MRFRGKRFVHFGKMSDISASLNQATTPVLLRNFHPPGKRLCEILHEFAGHAPALVPTKPARQ
jgi:hypothetical protein